MILIYLLAAIIIGLLIGAIWMPGHYHIEKSIVIARPPATVMQRVSDLNFYSQWNPWQQSDPTATSTITGTPGMPGHSYSWKGRKVGIGSLKLTSIDTRQLHFDLQFIKPFNSLASDNWLFEPWGEGETRITWQNDGKLPWPIARLVGPLMKKGLNRQFEQGLNNLKQQSENA